MRANQGKMCCADLWLMLERRGEGGGGGVDVMVSNATVACSALILVYNLMNF